MISIADESNIHKGYTITLPANDKGVYTVSVIPPKPQDQATLHIDQYSGKILMDLRFKDYGMSAKIIEIGIALHEGHYFGVTNQLIDLIICLVLASTTIFGISIWWKRKPADRIGSPLIPNDFKLTKGLIIIIILLGAILPLAGLSLIFVLIVDYLFIKRIPVLNKVFS
ncbi:PepSY-associated TM helix domain-containing protein [Gottfriedia acidiceleris]|uniref:PepSY-associated TM helix domain-containing protein n=1 Tax=Gottfriedia acidiceleris TaxID=371036 RepID=UPI001F387D81|nr:PepSY domain-containing protein [Gottfriedia acidiceleris]